MHRLFIFAILFAALGSVTALRADSIAISSAGDTGLIQLEPNNNMGGHHFFNVGSTLHGNTNRGLLRFDVAMAIPAGSKILSAQLVLEVVGIPIDEPAGGNFQLHRLLRPWGEGTNTSTGSPGRGAPATVGQSTWNSRFAETTNTWAVPGGLAGIDYLATVSGEQFIEPNSGQPYSFGSTTQMTADVQFWLDNPASDFGWLMKTEDELLLTTARRFASREDGEYGPQLVVEYDPPPRLIANRVGSELHIEFVAKPNEAYVFQNADFLGASWSSISNIAASAESRTIHLTYSISGMTEFFRLLVDE